MAKKEESALFAGITNGHELRRDVLGCSKGILESLKSYEQFKATRKEKRELMHKFKDDVKNIVKLMNKVKKGLPKVKDLGIKRPVKKEEVKKEKTKVIKVEKPRPKTEVERLEAELSDIESKLNGL